MCNKCEKLHSELYKNIHEDKIIKDINIDEIFSGYCNEKDHSNELIYFCKNHNKLCCLGCFSKIKTKNFGLHKDCDICLIEDIENEKKSKLKENIKYLEDLSITFEQSIKDLKKIFDKINEDKEKLKKNIQTIFTKIRNEVNNKEDKLLLEVDEKFNNIFVNEDLVKKSEKLTNKIKVSLEKGKVLEKKWKDNFSNSFIHDCINIEKNIGEIKQIDDEIKKYNSNEKMEIKIDLNENQINSLLKELNDFGKIISEKKKFK